MTERNNDIPREDEGFESDTLEHNQDDTTEKTMEEPVKPTGSRSKKYDTRKKENNMVRKIVLIITSALVVTLVIAGISFYNFFKSSLKPLDPKNTDLVQVEIPIGSNSKNIGQILEKDKVIKSGLVFSYYVKMNNITDFQAGFYQMAPSMTLDEITKNLQEGGTDEPEALADAKITIPEGYTVEQIADLMEKNTDLKKKDFMDVMEDDAFFNEMVEKYPDLLTSAKEAKEVRYRLEGYLYPATYNYYKDVPLTNIVEQMIAKTNQVMTPLYEPLKEKKLTVQEALTLASLVEKEGVSQSDRQQIAQVFFNRIAIDMPLQSDIAVLYAMNEHKVMLSEADTLIDSPYNLYVHPGTGPGPFNNPGEESVMAVLNPQANDNIYFLADVDTGKVYYAKDYEEHLRLKEKYIDDKQ